MSKARDLASGAPAPAGVSTTELGYVDGVTSAIQTQVDAKIAKSTATTKGDLLAATSSAAVSRLGVGSNGTVLTADSAQATGLKWSAPAGGSNWSLLNSGGTSLTGTSVTISGISDKDKIMILVSGLSTTFASGSTVQVRLNGDTASNYYAYGSLIRNSGAVDSMVLEVNENQSRINLAQTSNNTSSTASAGLTITGCNSNGVKQFIGSGGSEDATGSGNSNRAIQGYYNSASVITSITILASGDTMDAGTVFVYASA